MGCPLPATRKTCGYPLPAARYRQDMRLPATRSRAEQTRLLSSPFTSCILGTWLTTETSRYGKWRTN
jgi:hypothetical protein